jgi:hypothetical protein
MTFNRVTGERIDGLAQHFGRDPGPWRVVPTEKWFHIGDLWQRACQEAGENFAKAGAKYNQLKFFHDNVLVQEYPQVNAVVFLFWMPINFKDHYHVKIFEIERVIIAELKANGQWDETAEQTVH